jgi:co-chaperonin GroES (HSP10)
VELDKQPEPDENTGFRLDSDSVKERLRATVLLAGPGRLAFDGTRVDIELNPGDRVWLFPGAGQQVDDNEDLLLIREELIIGVIFEAK